MDILSAAASAGIQAKKVATTKGGEYAGPCPSCGGRDRFRIWPADKGGDGSFWCRGCGKGGDLVQFLVDFAGYEYKDAFSAVGRAPLHNYRPVRYRPAAPAPSRPEPFAPRHCEPPIETWQIRAEKLVDTCHQTLVGYPKAMDWLAARGLDAAAVTRFRLGWHPGEKDKPCSYRPRKAWGLPEVLNEKTGRPKMLWIPRGIVIPCILDNKIRRIRIRRPAADLKTDRDVKYYVLPGSGMEVMAINPDRQTLVVVEAELDAMLVAHCAGPQAGVVALGSAATKPDDTAFYHLKKALRVLVALDYDQAGQTAWAWWSENFKNAKLWPVPKGKDPGEAHAAGVDIGAWIQSGLPPVARLTAEDMGYQKPEGLYPIEELRRLLEQHPIKLHATLREARVLYSPGFKNQAVLQRVKELFLDGDEVEWFFREFHPDPVITGSNCRKQATAIQEVNP